MLAVQYRGGMFRRIRAVGRPGFIAGALWALMYICFILALGLTTVANVLVIASVTPFSAALLGRLFLQEHVPARTWLTMLAAFCGIVMMFMEAIDRGGLLGNLIALVIPFAFAVNVVILRRIEAHIDMIPTLVVSGLLSMAIMLPLALPLTPTAKDLGLLAIMGVVQLGIGVLMMILAAPVSWRRRRSACSRCWRPSSAPSPPGWWSASGPALWRCSAVLCDRRAGDQRAVRACVTRDDDRRRGREQCAR